MNSEERDWCDEQQRKQQAYRAVFMIDGKLNGAGKIIVDDLIEKGKVGQPLYGEDVNQMLINEGKRQMVLDILKYLNEDFRDFGKDKSGTMLNEEITGWRN